MFHHSRARRCGLTLIELVVVLAILASLAILIVPRLDSFKGQSDTAAAATNASELVSLLQLQKTSSGAYPNFDLLLDETDATYSKLWSTGGSPFTATTIPGPGPSGSWYRSLLSGGIINVLKNSSTATNASSSGVATNLTVVQTAITGSGFKMAELNYSASAGTHPYVGAIDEMIFPGGVDSTGAALGTNVKLVAVGLGPNSGFAYGNTIPLDSQGDDAAATYCRYIAVFAIYKSGKAAELRMVTDHRLRPIDRLLSDYQAASSTGI